MKTVRSAFALLLGMSAGCLVLPTPEHGSVSNRPVLEESVGQSLQVGTTTREDVLLRFGEPELVLRHEQVFAYSWDRIVAYVVWAVAATGQAGVAGAGGLAPVTREHVLLLQFDDAGVLQRADLEQGVLLDARETAATWATEPASP